MTSPGPSKGAERIDPLIGTLLAGKYKIHKKIGEGGMGSVYIADQEPIDRKVAVKVLLSKLAEDDVAVKRFKQEAHAISRMQHPNTVTIYDFGETEDQRLYIVMEYLRGKTLTQVLRQEGVLSAPRACKIIRQVCGSLADAHASGIIHRDLKPDNIFLCEVGGDPDWVKVLDFGVAKLADSEGAATLTQTGMIFGTPKYMSPEQAEGRPIDYRADIYALGVVLYELLVGRPPFVADTPVGLLLKHISEPPPPFARLRPDLSIDPRIEAIAMKALEKQPDRRQQIVSELAQELGTFERAVSGMTPIVVPGGAAPTGQVMGLPTEVIPGTLPGGPITPANLMPPNQVPGNLSLGLPSETKNIAPPTMNTSAEHARTLGAGGGAHQTAPFDALPTSSVMPFAPGAPNPGLTRALTQPIAAPGSGVDTLGGVVSEISIGVRPPVRPKTRIYLLASAAFFSLAGGIVILAMNTRVDERPFVSDIPVERAKPLEAPPQPRDMLGGTTPPDPIGGQIEVKAPGAGVGADPPPAVDPGSKKPVSPSGAIERRGKKVLVRLESSPPGAAVLGPDRRHLGTTPMSIEVLKNDTVTFVFSKEGYEEAPRTVVASSDRIVQADLKRAAGQPQSERCADGSSPPCKAAPVDMNRPKPPPPDRVDPKLNEKVDDLKE